MNAGKSWNNFRAADAALTFLQREGVHIAEATKEAKESRVSDEENIDLSAGLVPKSLQAKSSTEPTSVTPDSFMEQQSPAAIEETDSVPIDEKPISWRWCADADMPALQQLNFEAELTSGEAIYLPEKGSTLR